MWAGVSDEGGTGGYQRGRGRRMVGGLLAILYGIMAMLGAVPNGRELLVL